MNKISRERTAVNDENSKKSILTQRRDLTGVGNIRCGSDDNTAMWHHGINIQRSLWLHHRCCPSSSPVAPGWRYSFWVFTLHKTETNYYAVDRMKLNVFQIKKQKTVKLNNYEHNI